MSVLIDAEGIVNGARQEAYGDPVNTQVRIGQAWGAILGCRVTAVEVGLCMAALKLVREATGKHSRDNLVDTAGYAELANRAADAGEHPRSLPSIMPLTAEEIAAGEAYMDSLAPEDADLYTRPEGPYEGPEPKQAPIPPLPPEVRARIRECQQRASKMEFDAWCQHLGVGGYEGSE